MAACGVVTWSASSSSIRLERCLGLGWDLAKFLFREDSAIPRMVDLGVGELLASDFYRIV